MICDSVKVIGEARYARLDYGARLARSSGQTTAARSDR
jgi:hypothetical protein